MRGKVWIRDRDAIKRRYMTPKQDPSMFTDADDVPPLSDPRWHEWSLPLLSLLQRPRRWPRLMRWAETLGYGEAMLRQLVAALEEFGLAESTRHGGKMIWRQRRDRARDWVAPSSDR